MIPGSLPDFAPGLGLGALIAAVAMLGVMYSLPVYVVRIMVRLYPRDDPRRSELVAEMHRAIAAKDRWPWLFETIAVSTIEGPKARAQARRSRRMDNAESALRRIGLYLGLLEDPRFPEAPTRPRRSHGDVGLDIFIDADDLAWARDRAEQARARWVCSELREWIRDCEVAGTSAFPLPGELQERWGVTDPA